MAQEAYDRNLAKARSLLDTGFLGALKPTEVGTMSALAAETLIDNPLILPAFTQVAREAEFVAQVSEDGPLRSRVGGYLRSIKDSVRKYPWIQKRGVELGIDEARALLIALPSEPVRKPTPERTIADAVLKGYFETRFNSVKEGKDLKGALFSYRRFLEAALFPEPDVALLQVWSDLRIGRYKEVAGIFSVANKALALYPVAVDPSQEDIYSAGYELSVGISFIHEILGRSGSIEDQLKLFAPYGAQVQAADFVIRSGFDPRRGQGRTLYSGPALEQTKRLPSARADFPDVNYRALSKEPVPDEVVEVLKLAGRPENAERLKEAQKRAGDARKNLRERKIKETTFNFPRVDIDEPVVDQNIFPWSVTRGKSEILNRLYDMLKPQDIAEAVKKIVGVYREEMGSDASAEPFNLFGLTGYFISNNITEQMPPQEKADFIAREITENQVKGKYEERLNMGDSRLLSGIRFGLSTGDILILKEALATKSELGSLLDLHIDKGLYDRIPDLLRSNIELTGSVPAAYTRTPTQSGDEYVLDSHPDVPGVISSAVVRKVRNSGLNVEMKFVGDDKVVSDKEVSSSWSVNFQNGRVNIVAAEGNQAVSRPQEIVLDQVILRLIEKSCAPSLEEVAEEVGELEKKINEEGVDSAIPGRIVHVGGFRPSSGERRRYTPRAEAKFAEIVRDLFGEAFDTLGEDARGISLSRINELHFDSGVDPRWLTYNQGREANSALPPQKREAPENLVPAEIRA